jgi:HK97 family phage major capsid protein
MARNDIDATGWLVEDKDSDVVKAFAHTSAWEKATRPISMNANTVRIPRIEDMDVDVIPKGSAYGEDASTADTVPISAAKFGKALRIAEEDVDDNKLADYLELKKQSAASSFAKKFDNAAIGTSAADNNTTVPFTSLYRALTTADATTGYTANANVLTSVGAGGVITYDLLSQLLSIAEGSAFYDETNMSIIAHPAFKGALRLLKDGQNRPLFYSDVNGQSVIDRLFGIQVFWSNGARVTATAMTVPTGSGIAPSGVKGTAGNPLLALVNKPYAVTGNRTPFESVLIPGRDGLAGLTDEDILKVRTRKAAGVTNPKAHAVLELVTA